MKTQGEIEAAISEVIRRFEVEYMGRGPANVHTYLLKDIVLVRLTGVLTAAEQRLAKTHPPEKGRDLLKQVRTHLVEIARPNLEELIKAITDTGVVSMHHDISTATGEEVLLFTLNAAPVCRETKSKTIGKSS